MDDKVLQKQGYTFRTSNFVQPMYLSTSYNVDSATTTYCTTATGNMDIHNKVDVCKNNETLNNISVILNDIAQIVLDRIDPYIEIDYNSESNDVYIQIYMEPCFVDCSFDFKCTIGSYASIDAFLLKLYDDVDKVAAEFSADDEIKKRNPQNNISKYANAVVAIGIALCELKFVIASCYADFKLKELK